MRTLGITTAVIGGIALSAIWSGYVLSVLWGWFVVPLFESAPTLSVLSAIGISMTINFLTYHHDARIKDERPTRERFADAFLFGIMRPLLALVFAGILRLFM